MPANPNNRQKEPDAGLKASGLCKFPEIYVTGRSNEVYFRGLSRNKIRIQISFQNSLYIGLLSMCILNALYIVWNVSRPSPHSHRVEQKNATSFLNSQNINFSGIRADRCILQRLSGCAGADPSNRSWIRRGSMCR